MELKTIDGTSSQQNEAGGLGKAGLPTKKEAIMAGIGGFLFNWALTCPWGQKRINFVEASNLSEFEEAYNDAFSVTVCLGFCAAIWLLYPWFVWYKIKLLEMYKIMNINSTIYQMIESLFNGILPVYLLMPVPLVVGKVFEWNYLYSFTDTDNNSIEINIGALMQLLLARLQGVMWDATLISLIVICGLHWYLFIKNKIIFIILFLVVTIAALMELFAWDESGFFSKSGYSQLCSIGIYVVFGLSMPIWLAVEAFNLNNQDNNQINQIVK